MSYLDQIVFVISILNGLSHEIDLKNWTKIYKTRPNGLGTRLVFKIFDFTMQKKDLLRLMPVFLSIPLIKGQVGVFRQQTGTKALISSKR